MGTSIPLQGSGAAPSPMQPYQQPPMQQSGLSMPPRPPMSTYSTPGAGVQATGQLPPVNAPQGSNPMQLANALGRM